MKSLKEQLDRLDREAKEPAMVCISCCTSYAVSRRRCPLCGSLLSRVGPEQRVKEPKCRFDETLFDITPYLQEVDNA